MKNYLIAGAYLGLKMADAAKDFISLKVFMLDGQEPL